MKYCNPTTLKVNVISCVLKLQKGYDITHESDYIIKKVCNALLIEEFAIKGKTQLSKVVDARIITIHFMKLLMPELNHEKIGQLIGRDRSSIYYSLNKVKDLLVVDKCFRKKFDLINSLFVN